MKKDVEIPDENMLEKNYRLDREILELCRKASELLTEVEMNFAETSDRVREARIKNARTSIKEFRDWSEKVLEESRSEFIG